MSERKKISVLEVDNGYIVTVHESGLGLFKESFQKSILVFTNIIELIEWEHMFFRGKKSGQDLGELGL